VLEGAAAIVFAAANGNVCREDLAYRASTATGSIVTIADIDAVLAELGDAGLLKGPRGMSRRVLLGGLVAGAAVVAAAPLVTSLAKPASAANFSPSGPVAVLPVSASTTTGTSIQIPLASTGFTADYLVYWNVTQPSHGTVTVTNTSSGGLNTGAYALYTPNPGYTGSDSFNYVAGECLAPPGAFTYIAPPAAQNACPAPTIIGGSYIQAATVSITIAPPPTTTTTSATTDPAEASTPKYTG
jgi:hypothetical protein